VDDADSHQGYEGKFNIFSEGTPKVTLTILAEGRLREKKGRWVFYRSVSSRGTETDDPARLPAQVAGLKKVKKFTMRKNNNLYWSD
jgi:hypothetical protein